MIIIIYVFSRTLRTPFSKGGLSWSLGRSLTMHPTIIVWSPALSLPTSLTLLTSSLPAPCEDIISNWPSEGPEIGSADDYQVLHQSRKTSSLSHSGPIWRFSWPPPRSHDNICKSTWRISLKMKFLYSFHRFRAKTKVFDVKKKRSLSCSQHLRTVDAPETIAIL